jgi:hypothetical protein
MPIGDVAGTRVAVSRAIRSRRSAIKIVITTLLALAVLGGCAQFTTTTSSPSASPRDRDSSDCRGVWDQLGHACIGG